MLLRLLVDLHLEVLWPHMFLLRHVVTWLYAVEHILKWMCTWTTLFAVAMLHTVAHINFAVAVILPGQPPAGVALQCHQT